MTIQPLKNDQDVAQGLTTAMPLSGKFGNVQGALPAERQPMETQFVSDVVSGAVKAPVSISAKRLDTTRNITESRMEQIKVIQSAAIVSKQMGEIKHISAKILHSFPPFFTGDEERQRYLMSISSIRDMIAKLTIPSKDTSSQVKIMTSELFKGIQIPYLQPSGQNEATDGEIAATYNSVDSMQAVLNWRSSLMAQQIMPVSSSSSFAEQVSISVKNALSASSSTISSNLRGVIR